MKTLNRRDVCVGLPALAAMAGATARGQAAKVEAKLGTLGEARVFPLERMPVRTMANGGESRDVLRGALASGEAVAVHETVLPVGSAPNPRHTIQHSELILVREGTVEFQHGELRDTVGGGGVIYVAMGTLHGLKNVGDVPAKYFVVQIGGDTK